MHLAPCIFTRLHAHCHACRFVRLEALEGISAFLRQDQRTAQTSLQSALAKWQRLQVSDEALALLAGMGFSAREVRRPACSHTALGIGDPDEAPGLSPAMLMAEGAKA